MTNVPKQRTNGGPAIPSYPANAGPAMAGKLRARQEQASYAASLIDAQLRLLEDAAVELFAVEDQRANATARLHQLAESNRSRRGRR